LPENNALRSRHADLPEFVKGAIRTPLLFEPGSRYEYSSMGILLASEIARRITGKDFREFIDEVLFRPLEMERSALGLGRFKLDDLVRCQIENAAPESGAGDVAAKNWDWNSPYWRKLGSPWGGVHASASDVARFFAEFLHPSGASLKPETARLMIENHNRAGLTSRGLGDWVSRWAPVQAAAAAPTRLSDTPAPLARLPGQTPPPTRFAWSSRHFPAAASIPTRATWPQNLWPKPCDERSS
jgi:CubicO group peptidase (beta-lactamase class C family)